MGNNNPARQLSTLPADFFDSRLDEVRKILPPDTISAEALVRVILTAMNKAPKLRQCTQESVLGCLLDIASLGLLPNTPLGHAYLIPYGNQATLQIGYKGFAELSYRTGQVKVIKGDVVRAQDTFEYAKGSGINEFVKHVKDYSKGRNQREVLAAWSSIELMSGGYSIEVMDQDELYKIKQMAPKKTDDRGQKDLSPSWKYWEDEMFKKSVFKRNAKLLQIGNMEMVTKAIEIDNRNIELPGIEVPAKSEHQVIIGDAPIEGAEEASDAQEETKA